MNALNGLSGAINAPPGLPTAVRPTPAATAPATPVEVPPGGVSSGLPGSLPGSSPSLPAGPAAASSGGTTPAAAARRGSDAGPLAPGAAARTPTEREEEAGGEGSALQQRLAEQAEALTASLQNVRRELRFSVDPELGQLVVKVMGDNEEVIRQIPAEEVLELARRLKEGGGLLPPVQA